MARAGGEKSWHGGCCGGGGGGSGERSKAWKKLSSSRTAVSPVIGNFG